MGACASIGHPQGGPRDEDPPVAVRTVPAQAERNVSRRTFSVYFDENVALDDAFNKVAISPVQSEPAQISANGRHLTVELRDTLIPDATYTIDFGDAIKDLNEGNVLDGFALEFSTGAEIDTLRVAGRVMQASNLEPAQGMLVAAYSNLADSAIRTLRPDRIARTNQTGQFTLRNLAPRPYRIYALNDINRDWHWDRSEDVAFLDTVITPYLEQITVTDTLYNVTGEDSLVTRPGRRFMPNDILLTWFNENFRQQYLRDHSRPNRRQIILKLGAETDSLPVLRDLDGRVSDRWAMMNVGERSDSLVYWMTDTAMLADDSLRLEVTYQKPDSLERIYWQTDTLNFFFKDPKPRKKSKKELEADTVPPSKALLTIKSETSQSQELNEPLRLTFGQPPASLDTAGFRLQIQVDTLWQPVTLPPIVPDPKDPLLGIMIPVRWEPGGKYKFEIDSAAVTGIYDEHNPPFRLGFSVKSPEDYATLTFAMTEADTTAIVELLDNSDKPKYSVRADASGRAVFQFLAPGTYYARMFFDENGDGKWTTGILDSVQPEEVSYFPKKIDVKRNWEIEQAWDIYGMAVDQQKPKAILKNKPKLKRGERDTSKDEDEEDEDPELGSGRTGRTDRNSRNNNNGLNNNLNGLGGGRFQRNGQF